MSQITDSEKYYDNKIIEKYVNEELIFVKITDGGWTRVYFHELTKSYWLLTY